jgi:hypothetical protein
MKSLALTESMNVLVGTRFLEFFLIFLFALGCLPSDILDLASSYAEWCVWCFIMVCQVVIQSNWLSCDVLSICLINRKVLMLSRILSFPVTFVRIFLYFLLLKLGIFLLRCWCAASIVPFRTLLLVIIRNYHICIWSRSPRLLIYQWGGRCQSYERGN